MPHDELPLPDYDHLPTGALAGRIRSLGLAQLDVLLAYEQQHADRLDVRLVLQRRRDEVAAGAPLSDGSPVAAAPEVDPGVAGGSPVTPQTQGPALNPPSHGDPTNPAQPR